MKQNLFQLILRQSYQSLPPALQHFHEPRLGHFEGKAFVKGDNGALAKLLRKLNGFPAPSSEEMPIVVKVVRSESEERWLRKFGETKFSSKMTRISGENVLSEDFGLFRFKFSLSFREDRIHWNLVGWSFVGIPMPDALGPTITAWEGVNADGNYHFASSVKFPLAGVLVDYAGWLDCK
ncbi:MAG: DUF4166 domain-containing protein [Pseudomonadota bacterium]